MSYGLQKQEEQGSSSCSKILRANVYSKQIEVLFQLLRDLVRNRITGLLWGHPFLGSMVFFQRPSLQYSFSSTI